MSTPSPAAPGVRRNLFRAAAMIAAITVVARLAGFLRTFVFARTVGSSCVGVVYQTANTVPNIVFDIVAGGTLTALVVPLVAPHLATGDREGAGRTVSALLSWAVVSLCAVGILIVAFSGPITRLLLGPQPCAGADDLGRRLLIVFAPQVVLYGCAVIVAGTLQAAERFSWPALAPLMSSLVVIGAYLAFNAMKTGSGTAASLPTTAELVLSVGTTAGVLVLAVSQLPATRGLALKLRPTFRFPTGLAPLVRRAAIAGGITLAAQQLATAVMLRVANGGSPGTLVVLAIAQTVYLVPWAVLAVPVATAMFPRLSAARESGDFATAAQIAGSGLRLVAAMAAIGTAGLVAAATPIANVLQDKHQDGHSVFAPAIAALSVGLIGWSIVALLARVLYAARRPQFAAAGQAAGWLITIAVDVIIALEVSRAHRAVALGLANALGVTVAAGALLVIAVRMGTLGPSAWVVRSLGAAVVAAGLGSAVGWAVSRSVTSTGVAASLAIGLVSAIVGIAVASGVVASIDRSVVTVIRSGGRRG